MPTFSTLIRLSLVAMLGLGIAGCSIIYKLPTRQGNVIEQKQLDQLQLGMSKDQVKFLLGTPIASDPFRDERWDYFGYYKSPRGKVSSRTVSLYFSDSKLARMEGVQLASNEAKNVDTPDLDAIAAQVKKDQVEKTRTRRDKDTGVAIPTP
ncbi:MAG: outer membrane protein assembly factor BamE [Nevskia sp.]|nr:outer membrane protein assembly factor BamE [Nevskia sp.]